MGDQAAEVKAEGVFREAIHRETVNIALQGVAQRQMIDDEGSRGCRAARAYSTLRSFEA